MTEMQSETVSPLGSIVQRRLAEIPALAEAQHCGLLNHPSHGNVGDHLIWVAQVHYLERVRQISVDYITAPDRYCPMALEQAIGGQPIVLSGGGQLGDTWLWLQEFIERVILRHRRNPLIIFPQSIHFRDRARLQKASAILQGHPNLTLVLRDQASFRLAQDHFAGCRLILSPDMAFVLPVGELAPESQGFLPPASRRPGSCCDVETGRGFPPTGSGRCPPGAIDRTSPIGSLWSVAGFGGIADCLSVAPWQAVFGRSCNDAFSCPASPSSAIGGSGGWHHTGKLSLGRHPSIGSASTWCSRPALRWPGGNS